MKYIFLLLTILLISCFQQKNSDHNQTDTLTFNSCKMYSEIQSDSLNKTSNSDSLNTKDTIEIITKLKSPFLEETIKLNDSISLLIYNGADITNLTPSLAICSFNGENLKLIVKNEILNKQIINTSKGPSRTLFIPGSVEKDGYVINHDDLSFEEIKFSEYDGSDYLEKIETSIFPVALLTIYTDSLVSNYQKTTETNPDNLPW